MLALSFSAFDPEADIDTSAREGKLVMATSYVFVTTA
jgi:hypothetical protein